MQWVLAVSASQADATLVRSDRSAPPWPAPHDATHTGAPDAAGRVVNGIVRRFRREVRRRKVARAYDMALEIGRIISVGADVLDIGCGNGFIAHHLSALLRTNVLGIDVGNKTEAPIDYIRYDGHRLPIEDHSCDAVTFCYVLHHAQDLAGLLKETRRVLRRAGLALIYEDIPRTAWDKLICWFHNQQWHKRTGPCTFRSESQWPGIFESAGFEILSERRLSRWRNLSHPVSRRFYLLRLAHHPATGATDLQRTRRLSRRDVHAARGSN